MSTLDPVVEVPNVVIEKCTRVFGLLFVVSMYDNPVRRLLG
jgi:hypothetical protein